MMENQTDAKKEKMVSALKNFPKATITRKQCDLLADSFQRLGYAKRATRVRSCGKWLHFESVGFRQRIRLRSANFCRGRLCPMCAWRRARQKYCEVSRIIDTIQSEDPKLVLMLLTLTMRNCRGVELEGALNRIFQGWSRMMKKDRMRRFTPGWFRTLEISYQGEDRYQTHIRAILLVHPASKRNPDEDMTQEKWVQAWRKAARLDYNPVCSVKRIRSPKGISDAIMVVAAPPVKETDYLKEDKELTDKLVEVFDRAVRGRWLYSLGGQMKKTAKSLNIQLGDEKRQDEII